ncbi:hypothetical protein DHL47_04335 [Streptococcus panodentis]|uniref:Transposase n=1 Tax=Streptococcus panodentis TaxID=1581472 RepID=A0ABS5AVJ0_9STRE|nr:hypothetical protein [Streptococcus panodentis]
MKVERNLSLFKNNFRNRLHLLEIVLYLVYGLLLVRQAKPKQIRNKKQFLCFSIWCMLRFFLCLLARRILRMRLSLEALMPSRRAAWVLLLLTKQVRRMSGGGTELNF